MDAKKLLAQFLGQKVSRGSGTKDILGGLGGMVGSGKGKGGIAGMVRDNPMAAAAIVTALLGSKKGRKMGGSALRLGGMAAVAGLGYLAYRNYRAGNKPERIAQSPQEVLPPPRDSGFASDPAETSDEFALALVKAMIAAAKSDGHIDADERANIVGKLAEDGLDADEMAFLQSELEAPVDLDAIVAAALTEEQKIEIYTASRMAIEPDTRAEKGYLDLLAGRLGLPDDLVDHIEATVAASKRQVEDR